MKRLTRILLSLCALLALLLVIVVLLLGTGPGLRLTASIINSVASTEDRQIEVVDLGGILTGSPKVGRVTIADGKGIWLTASGLEAEISMRRLIGGAIDVGRLDAESIAVARRPEPAVQTQSTGESGGSGLPSMPIRVDNINLRSLQLDEPVLGEAATLEITGNALLRSDPVDLSGALDVRRIDGTEGTVSAQWTIAPDLRELALKLDASEPADGLVARLLNIYGLPAIAIKLDGSGPLEDWKAALTVDLDNERTAEGNVALSLADDRQSVEGQLKGFLSPLLPQRIRPLFAGDTNVDLSLERDTAGTLMIHALDVRSALLSVTATGGVLADAGTVDLEADIAFGTDGSVVEFDLDDQNRLTIGYTQVNSSLKGSLEQADWALDGSVASLAQGERSVSGIRLSGQSSNVNFLERSGTATVELDAASVVSTIAQVDALLAGELKLLLDGSFRQTAFEIKQAALKTDAVDLEVSGQANLAESEYNILLNGTVEAPEQDVMSAVLGSEAARISGRVVQQVAGTILLSDLVITSGNLSVSGGAEMSEGTIQANTQLSLSSLSALREEVEGGIRADISVDGDIAKPNIKIDAQGVDISILGKPLEDFSIEASGVADMENPQAELDIDGRYENQPVSVKASVSSEQGGAPIVESLDVNVPGANANGRLVANDAGILTGQMEVDITSLADLGQLFLQPDLSGSLSGSVEFSEKNSAQAISARLTAPKIETQGVEANALGLRADVDDVRTLEGLVASVTAESVIASGTAIENLDAQASGSLQNLPFSLNATLFDEPAVVGGTFSSQDGTITVALDEAKATFQTIPVELTEPVTVTVADARTNVETATLKVGPGEVVVSGTAAEELDFDVGITAFPMALIENVASTGLDQRGTLSGRATIRGAASDPSVDYELDLANFSVNPGNGSRTPDLAVQSSGQFESGKLTTQTMASGTDTDIRINGTVDINSGVQDALDVDVEIGTFALALAKEFVPVQIDPVGTLSGTATITGALNDPNVNYDLALAAFSVATGTGSRTPNLTVDSKGQFVSRVLTADLSASGTDTDVTVKGKVDINDNAESALDVDVDIKSFAVALVSDFVPSQFDQQGTLSGKATVSGALDDPDVDYDLDLVDFSVATGIGTRTPELRVQSKGKLASRVLTTELEATGRGTDLSVSGTVDTNSDVSDALDLQIKINAFSVLLLESVVPTGFGQDGTLSGDATVTGALTQPDVNYDLKVANFSIEASRDVRMPALSIASSGDLKSGTLTTKTTATGSGIDFTVDGSVGLGDSIPLDLKVQGKAPLELASLQLAESGILLEGSTQIAMAVSGTASSPLINGSVTASGVDFVDTNTSLTIREIDISISFDGTRASIDRLQGKLGSNGTVTAGGTIDLDPASGLPANLTLTVKDGRFASDIVIAELDADLKVEGPLLSSGKAAGTITLERADINIPDQLPASIPYVDVVHRNAPGRVVSQAQELAPASEETTDSTAPSAGLSLDITVNAPSRIFLRGRGIDAEFGGSIEVYGTSSDPRMRGSFSMIRGRMDVLTKRFVFDRGTITFDGTVDPVLDFSTTTRRSSGTYSILVTGTASSPVISFSSSPELPQDEILAQLFFGKNLSKLSAVQIAQLANAVAQLGGADNSGGLLGRLRGLAGVADIDINTDNEDGSTSVGIGGYINDRTYLNVEQGLGDSTGRVTIDMDLTEHLKIRGEADTDGNTKGGFYYERDY